VSSQSVLSLQYIQVQVLATVLGAPIDPTSDVVQFAFTLNGANPGTWSTGSWASDAPLANGAYIAQCLVGPGGTVTLTRGTWTTWIKVTDDPEIPVITAGELQIT
jgi:hypothetical protein